MSQLNIKNELYLRSETENNNNKLEIKNQEKIIRDLLNTVDNLEKH